MYRAISGGENSCVRRIVLIFCTTLRAEHLDALVVTINCLTAVVDNTDCTVCKLQSDQRGIYVVRLTDAGIDQYRTDCIDLGNLAASQETSHIKVVNHHVIEDTTGYFDVIDRRRLGITRGNLDNVDLADLAIAYHVVNCTMVVVKAAAETDLQLNARFLGSIDCRMHLREIIIDRLLAENVLACVRSLNDVLGMGVGRRANQNCLDFRIVQDIVCILGAILDAISLGKRLGLLVHKRVCDGLDFHLRYKHGDILCMNLADTACANNTNLHFYLPF